MSEKQERPGTGTSSPRAPSPVLEPGLPRGNRDYDAGIGTTSPRAGTGTTSHSIRSRSRTGTTKPRAGTGTTTEEHLKATGHHAKRHHSRVLSPVSRAGTGTTSPRAPSPVLEPGLRRGNRDYDAGTGTTSQTKSLKTPAGTEFIAHFGSFNGQREQQRWETLVEAIGWARAQEIASCVNSRPMYTSHSRIDGYHQTECGGG